MALGFRVEMLPLKTLQSFQRFPLRDDSLRFGVSDLQTEAGGLRMFGFGVWSSGFTLDSLW